MKVVWSPRGRADYKRLLGFIAGDSPNNVFIVQQRISKTISLLTDFQFKQVGPRPNTFQQSIQKTSYFVIYKFSDEETLEIVAFFHAARDWAKFSDKDPQ